MINRLYCKEAVVRVERDGKVWRLGVYSEVVRFEVGDNSGIYSEIYVGPNI